MFWMDFPQFRKKKFYRSDSNVITSFVEIEGEEDG